MANGRVLPSALLYDWLVGRSWNMAMNAYANAERLGSGSLGGRNTETGVSTGGGASIESFLSKYAGDESAALVTAHDRSLEGQMREVANRWAAEMQGVIASAAPIGPGFLLAVDWLRGVANGADGLGYLGYDHRVAQAQGYQGLIVGGINARGLPLQGVAGRESGLLVGRAQAQMQADRTAERHKLRIDAAEALIRARNEALDAAMEHTFTQMHLMFDVFGRNNDYLTALQRQEQAIKARMDIRTAELNEWNERIMTTDDSVGAVNQKLKALTERANTLDAMTAEWHIKLLRRYSSRAAAALNSVGVSVTSTASESNNIDAGG